MIKVKSINDLTHFDFGDKMSPLTDLNELSKCNQKQFVAYGYPQIIKINPLKKLSQN